MKPLVKMAVALRECKRCGNLVVVRHGVQDEHSAGGRLCEPKGRQQSRLERLLPRLSTARSPAPRTS
jgi:hypothetical protein